MSLTPKHRIRDTLRLSLGRRLHLLLLTSRRRGNHTVRGTIGDAVECICDTGQLECNLVGSARSLQHDHSFSAEIKSGPEHQPNHEGYNSHKHVVTGDGDASACDGNQVV